MIVRNVKDIRKLPISTKKVHVHFLTKNVVNTLLKKCPQLKRIVLTQSAKKKASKEVLSYLFSKKIDVVLDSSRQGRPIKFTREDLAKMITMHKEGASYEKIAKSLGLNKLSVSRALKGHTKFCRWCEDYSEGKEKVVWMITHDADPDARKLADNHYSRKTRGARYFCGPGEKLVLITPDKKALFVWRKNKYRQDGQKGIECALFRNEGAGLSSALIMEAVKFARNRWPGKRLFTYINPSAIKSKDPGFCFKKAGWKAVGINKNKRRNLIILEVT